MLDPLELPPDLFEHVLERLRHAVLSGLLKPGQRLVEDQLASQLGVSRAPVRDALIRLEQEGLVAPAGRRGKVVATVSAADAQEVYSLRGALESLAVELVIARGGTHILADLEGILDEMRTTGPATDLVGLSELDFRFHRAIAAASGHTRLLRSWDAMSGQMRLLSEHVIAALYKDYAASERHEPIVAAIRSGDLELARRLVREHIRWSSSIVKTALDSADDMDNHTVDIATAAAPSIVVHTPDYLTKAATGAASE